MNSPRERRQPLIAIVGPCKSGKSTLLNGLLEYGFNARQVAQEHSFAPSMWEQITNPDILVFLQCTYENTVLRGLNWTQTEYDHQQPRLEHARKYADLILKTDISSPQEILKKVINFLDFEARHKHLTK